MRHHLEAYLNHVLMNWSCSIFCVWHAMFPSPGPMSKWKEGVEPSFLNHATMNLTYSVSCVFHPILPLQWTGHDSKRIADLAALTLKGAIVEGLRPCYEDVWIPTDDATAGSNRDRKDQGETK